MEYKPLSHYWTSISVPYRRICEIAFVILLIATAARLLVLLERYKWLKRQKLVTLEVTPPAHQAVTLEATDQLFQVLHSLHRSRRLTDRFFAHQPRVALELVATKQQGIRYILRIPHWYEHRIEQQIHAHLPSIKLVRITDPSAHLGYTCVHTYKLRSHYAFPLASFAEIESKDPLSYVTGALTKLNSDEQAVFQLVITPILSKEALTLSRKLLINGDLIDQLSSHKFVIIPAIMRAINGLLFAILELGSSVFHPFKGGQSYTYAQRSMYDQQQIARRLKPARQVSYFEQQILGSMHVKLSKPLFAVSARAGVFSRNADDRLRNISSALEAYSVPGYQEINRRWLPSKLQPHLRESLHVALSPLRIKQSMILSTSELASLYHFPANLDNTAENTVQTLSRVLPAPISLKTNAIFDVVLGMNKYQGTDTPIGLTASERERHVYIIGGTGNGKTTMLQYSIVQDMKAGKGLAVIDPHGDMAEHLLRHVPVERLDDVVYFNPDDFGYPIGLNILELPSRLEGDELLREKDLITESVVSIFRKIFSEDDSGGHRIEYVLRNAIQTALTVEGATLFTIFELLNNPKYRKKIVTKLDNQDLKNFWKHELGKAGEMQRVKMAAGITTKIGRFLFSAGAKRILEQPKSTIDFDDILASSKILICNFSKGLLGEDTSELFGITVLAKLQLASLRRARTPQAQRKPFFLYVDEFQNFATQSFVQMLSEARKYKLFMIMAEQSTSQQKDKDMTHVVLANVGTIVTFRTGNPEDERLLLPLFSPYIQENEISNQPPFQFYARLAATKSQEPLSGMTLLLNGDGDEHMVAKVIQRSRILHASEHQQIVDQLSAVIEEPEDMIKPTTLVSNPEDLLKA